MKLVKIGKTMVAGLCIAATLAGAALPTMALSPAGYTSLAQLEEENEATTPEQVEAQINQIGPITLESATAIANAQGAYDSLPDEWKAMVSNYETLKAAQKELEDLQVAELTEKLNAGLYKEHDDVENYDCYLWSGWPISDQSNFAMPYFCISEKNGIEPMRMMYCSYSGSWLFMNQVVYSVDGEVYQKSLDTTQKFSQVVTEVWTKNIYTWEKIDGFADSKEIEMLRKAASSENAVIRLKGDNKKIDLKLKTMTEYKKSLAAFFDAYDSLMAASPEVREKALANMKSHMSNSKFMRLGY